MPFPFPLPLFLISISISVFLFPAAPADLDPHFLNCSTPTACGHLNITYPFYLLGLQPNYCGFPGFAISCVSGLSYLNYSSAAREESPGPSLVYLVHHIFYSNSSILVSSTSLSISGSTFSPCVTVPPENVSLPPTQVFSLNRNSSVDLMLRYNCTLPGNRSRLFEYDVGCPVGNAETGTVLAIYEDGDTELLAEASSECVYTVEVPVQSYWNGSRDIGAAVRGGFLMDWTASDCRECARSGGRCGFNFTSLHFWCYCPDRPHALQCSADGTNDVSDQVCAY